MQRLTELKVWQVGHALVLEVYQFTGQFNIAEGSKKTSNLGYVDAAIVQPIFTQIAELARMLHTLRTKVEQGV